MSSQLYSFAESDGDLLATMPGMPASSRAQAAAAKLGIPTAMAGGIPRFDKTLLPDISDDITPYLIRTLEAIHRIYGTNQITKELSTAISFSIPHPQRLWSHTAPLFDVDSYNMNFFTDRAPLPYRAPFAADHMSCTIPTPNETYQPGTMTDIVEAIRHTTRMAINHDVSPKEFAFLPPTTLDIQDWLSWKWPEKYPSGSGVAQGWRNTVNQCLTHGQGWNFLTFAPRDGTKNKRHLLFERAFNGTIVVGSGQCKGYNDMKPNRRRGQSPSRRTVGGPLTPKRGRDSTLRYPRGTSSTAMSTGMTTPPPVSPSASYFSPPSDSSGRDTPKRRGSATSGGMTTPTPRPSQEYSLSPVSDSSMSSSSSYLAPSSPSAYSDSSAGSFTELYVPSHYANAYDTLFDPQNLDPSLVVKEQKPVHERTLAEIEADLMQRLGGRCK
jgi:hypothetical protein